MKRSFADDGLDPETKPHCDLLGHTDFDKLAID